MAALKTINTRCTNGVSFGHRLVVAKDIVLGTREDLNALNGGGAAGIGPWLVTGKASVDSAFGVTPVGGVFTSVAGTEIPITGDTAQFMTLAAEVVGDDTSTFTVLGGGAGLYLITAKAGVGSYFGANLVGAVVTVLAADIMATGDAAQKVTLGTEVIGEDFETEIPTAFLFDFDTEHDMAFKVGVTAANGTPKTSVVITNPAAGQVLVTYTAAVGDIISVVGQRASEANSSTTAVIV